LVVVVFIATYKNENPKKDPKRKKTSTHNLTYLKNLVGGEMTPLQLSSPIADLHTRVSLQVRGHLEVIPDPAAKYGDSSYSWCLF
jgi:hypothetical protein